MVSQDNENLRWLETEILPWNWNLEVYSGMGFQIDIFQYVNIFHYP